MKTSPPLLSLMVRVIRIKFLAFQKKKLIIINEFSDDLTKECVCMPNFIKY